MAETASFKSRVRDIAMQYGAQYNSYYVRRSYLLFSDAFKNKPYYIVEAEATNYLHLLGVSTSLSAETFYNKCLTGVLTEDDFELSFHGRDPKFSKGSIRQKILNMPNMFGLLSSPNLVEEDFEKNVVRCTFASSDSSCTLGFIATPNARPMTLLRGDELDHSKASPLSLVLSKSRDDDRFSQILVGSEEDAANKYPLLKPLISQELSERLTNLLQKIDDTNESAP